jgi:hypothetical protein
MNTNHGAGEIGGGLVWQWSDHLVMDDGARAERPSWWWVVVSYQCFVVVAWRREKRFRRQEEKNL